jgi:hypothetical protein
MFVKQISVFLENSKGSLVSLTRLLKEHKIDLIALSIADTEHYGILRCITTNLDQTVSALREAGYTVRLTDVLAVCVDDRPGGLNDILEMLSDENISVEYLYSFVRTSGDHAMVIFHLSDLERGYALLANSGVTMLEQEQVRKL